MKDTIEITYMKQHTIKLDDTALNNITQVVYDAFFDEVSDYIDDNDPKSVPGNVLKEIFRRITENIMKDEEFWED